MNLQQLQLNICSLIKSRSIPLNEQDDYLEEISASPQLLLVKKIALWWRKIQLEASCLLTVNLLKINGKFEEKLEDFFNEQKYSAFREEVCMQFLKYIMSGNTGLLTRSVAEFEFSIIKLKSGEDVQSITTWPYEPHAVINGLLENTLDIKTLERGMYHVEVSSADKQELFTVRDAFISEII